MNGSSPYIVALATFATSYYHGTENLSLQLVALTMSVFYAIRLQVMYYFPMSLQLLFEGRVGCRRVQVSADLYHK